MFRARRLGQSISEHDSAWGMHCGKMTSRWKECEASGYGLEGNPGPGHSCGSPRDTCHQPQHHCRPGTPLHGDGVEVVSFSRTMCSATLHTLFENGLRNTTDMISLIWSDKCDPRSFLLGTYRTWRICPERLQESGRIPALTGRRRFGGTRRTKSILDRW